MILVSKIFQNIANQVEFDGDKESYMLCFNEFVQKTTPSMMAFVSSLMNGDHAKRTKPAEKRHKSFKGRMSQIITGNLVILSNSADFGFKDNKPDKPEGELKTRYIVDAPMQLPNLPIRLMTDRKLCYSTTGPDEDR